MALPLSLIVGEGLACDHFVIKDACTVVKENYVKFAVRLWAGVGAIGCASWSAGYVGHSIAVGPAQLRWLEVGILTSLAAGYAGWTFGLQKADRFQVAQLVHERWLARDATQAQPVA